MIDATRPAPTRDTVAAIAARVPPAPPGIADHRDEISGIVATIVERFRPERVILFGSRARGTPRPDSDADLMVIADPPVTRGQVEDAIVGTRSRLPIGVQVRTPEQIRVGLAEGDFFMLDVMAEGATLYASAGSDARMIDGTTGNGGARPHPRGLSKAAAGWIEKAELDLRLARRAADPPDPIWDGVCFHAQQCAEKYLKAFLQQSAIRFPRTHDLKVLAALAGVRVPGLAALEPDLDGLSKHGVNIRYPGIAASQAEAEHALGVAADLRALLRPALGLDSGGSSGP